MDQASGFNDASRGTIVAVSGESILEANNVQRALATQPWKEYTAEGGRKYWYNTESKSSSWEMPEAYKTALAQAAPTPKPSIP